MIVCDHCLKPEIIKNTIKLNGKTFSLCSECSNNLILRIENHNDKKKNLLEGIFK